MAIRWFSAPFPAIAAALPPGGRVLEIGCGHGLFSAYAALLDPTREVLGVDIDADKIDAAQVAARAVEHLEIREAPDGAVPDGPWDVVVFVDVLYLLPADEQRRLLAEAVRALAPGGRVVVKEMGTRPAWKVRWNTVQETAVGQGPAHHGGLVVRLRRPGHDGGLADGARAGRRAAPAGRPPRAPAPPAGRASHGRARLTRSGGRRAPVHRAA